MRYSIKTVALLQPPILGATMTGIIVQFLFSALTIVIAGIFLARAASSIAELTKIGRLLAGSILLAGATSLPELLVSASAIRKGMPDLAVGDLIGACLMNLLVLAIADIFHRSPHKMLSRSGAQHALSASISINMLVIAAIAIFLGPYLMTLGAGEIGLGPITIGLAYILGLRLVYFDQKATTPTPSAANRKRALTHAFSTYLFSALMIFVAAPFLAEAAGKIADLSGLGTSFVGTTLLAICTSLPETVSTIAAVRMGAFDLAVGNIFGSNSFNMLLFIPLDLIHEGNLLGAVSRTHIFTILAVILATTVAVMGQLYHEEKRRKFIEPDAFAVIGIVLGSIFILYWIGSA